MEKQTVLETSAVKMDKAVSLEEIATESLEEILERQCELLRELAVATAFIKCKRTMKDDLVQWQKYVSSVGTGIDGMMKQLNEMKQQNICCHEVMVLLKALDKKILHMNDNVPPKLILDYKTAKEEHVSQSDYVNKVDNNVYNNSFDVKTPVNSTANQTNQINSSARAGTQSATLKNCKKSLFYDPDVCPVVLPITKEEFSNLPKYMIGRQPLDMLNNLVNTINQIVKSKYGLLYMGKAAARKKGQLDIYLNYKKQEVTDDNGYMYFFTVEDYQAHTDTKLDKTKLTLLTCLRHCKRIREYRAGLLRYVIMTG